MILALTSDIVDAGADVRRRRRRSCSRSSRRSTGVGQVIVGGGALPAVRVEVNPTAAEQLRHRPGGRPHGAGRGQREPAEGTARRTATSTWAIDDQRSAVQGRATIAPLIVAYRNGAPVRLADVADVTDSVEDVRTARPRQRQAGRPASSSSGSRAPTSSRRSTASARCCRSSRPRSRRRSTLVGRHGPHARRSAPRCATCEITLLISIALVILVVFVFLRNVRATLIPSVAVPVSLIGTFGVMYLLGYSLDNLSLMALTDRHRLRRRRRHRGDREHHAPPRAGHAADARRRCRGASEIGFTVLSISVSLVAVFIPILLMGGIVGRLFREFAVTLSVAIVRLDGRLADDDADDVRARCCKPARRAAARPALPRERAGLRLDARAATRRRSRWVLRHQPLDAARDAARRWR